MKLYVAHETWTGSYKENFLRKITLRLFGAL